MKTILFSFIFCLMNACLTAQPGTLDSSFGNNGVSLNDNIRSNAVALQHSGKIITCGNGLNNNIAGLAVSRYNINGTIDSLFGSNGYSILDNNIYGIGEFFCLTILPDDKIIAAGNINNNIELAKFTADGKLDSSFGNNGVVQTNFGQLENAFAIQIQSDGKIVVAGQSSPDLVTTSGLVVRYFSSGELDNTFGDQGKMLLPEALRLFSLAIQQDGKLVTGGVTNIAENEFYLGRLNENGSYDTNFGNNGYISTRFSNNHRDELHSLVIQQDGNILGAGISNSFGADQDMGVARYNTNGSLDSSFGTGGLQSIIAPNHVAEATAVLLQKDGKIILSGRTFNDNKFYSDAMLARLNSNGNIDSSFGINGLAITDLSGGGYDAATGAILQTDGKIISVGESSFTNNNYGNIARYNNNDISRKQIIINKIKHYIQTHNNENAVDSKIATANISVYPNPVNNILTIKGLNATMNYDLLMMNDKGAVIKQASANNISSYQFNVQNLSSGVYYVSVVSNQKIITTLKFVRE